MICQKIYKTLLQYNAMELNEGCLKESLDEFQIRNNIKLPTQLIQLLMFFDGGEIFVPGTVIYGIEKRKGVNIKIMNSKEHRTVFRIPNTLLIFGKVNYGDWLCIDLNGNNEIIQWDHEKDEEFCRWGSLEEWLEDTIKSYEE